mmetsp:Transcript_29062/g.84867  ORF Transcript_29062/g.84867 Transcript_29062/m.84867 type:complete len:262 (-) Transcript_29062:123-908(-)
MASVQLPDVSGAVSRPKLEQLLDGFDPFEEKMQISTRSRLLKDKQKVDAQAKETERLTNALSEQVARRRKTNEDLQRHCEGRMQVAYREYDQLVAERTTRVEQRLEALDERISALDNHFMLEKQRIEREIEERHVELMDMLEKFHVLFEEECAVRAEREAAIKAEMAEHEKDVEQRFKEEKVNREVVIAELQKELGENIQSRNVADHHFETFVDTELEKLKVTFVNERRVREVEDDEIEAALSRYTNKLQSSLHIINSTDA